MAPPPLERVTRALAPRYRVEGELGSGGTATVYRAEDVKHHRKVAIKVLRPEISAILGTERFLKEIQLTANLQHPHVLPLYDSGEADGVLFYVMPHVEGESLRERLDRQGRLEIGEALAIAREVAAALHYAHGRGVVHRDVKPENVMLQEGQAVVADFGIALAVAEAAGPERLTATGVSLGTPGYMSPEQAAGEHELDRRTDVYALGALLYEMLAGQPPFRGDTARAVLARVLTETPRPIRELRPEVSADVEAAVARALARAPEDRFPTAQDFVRHLHPVRGEAGAAGSPGRRRGRVVAMAGAGLVVAAALVVGLLWRRRDDREAWARREAVPEVQRLLGESRISPAFHLAMTATRYLPDDPTLAALLDASSVRVDLGTDPSGA
ncbi:MAG TPA: serine/threonine-protein kinase, partial [Longimicrobiales bacterium]|nr:serine/threonine-protein kinase [Longimicrobiales bacterium]